MKIPFQKSIITSRRSLVRRKQYQLLTPEEATRQLFEDFVGEHLNVRKKKVGMPGPAEETVAELIRHGVPKSAVSFCMSYLAVTLAHATCYFYRTDPARILGTLHPDGNGYVDDSGHAYLDPGSQFLF